MEPRQRPNEPRTQTAGSGEGDSGASALGPLREQARAGLSVAYDAIDQALQNDTGQYLGNRLQRGGQ